MLNGLYNRLKEHFLFGHQQTKAQSIRRSKSAMNTETGAPNAAPPYDAANDRMDEALKALVGKIRSQMEVLSKKNQSNEHENASLRQENSSCKEQLINLEREHADLRQKRESEVQTRSLQQQRVESRFNEQLSAMAKEKQCTGDALNAQIADIQASHDEALKAERRNFDNVRAQKLSQDLKLREMLESNDALCAQLQDAKRSNLDLSASTKAEKRKMEQRIASLNAENVRNLCAIRLLEDELSTVRTRYEAIQTAMDTMIASTTKQIETHSFWSSNADNVGDANKGDSSELREHTDQRRLVEIDLFAKRIIALQTRLRAHKDRMAATHIRLSGKVEMERLKSADLGEQVRDLQAMRDTLLDENYRLLTDGDTMKAELQLSKVTATAQQSFSEMKSGELEQRMLCLHDDLNRKKAQILKLEGNEAIAKKAMLAQTKARQTEVARLQHELQTLSQSSSELLQSSINGAIEQLRCVSDEYAMRSTVVAEDKEQLVRSPKVLPRIVADCGANEKSPMLPQEVEKSAESPKSADLSEGVVESTMQLVKFQSGDGCGSDEEKDAVSEEHDTDTDESSRATSPGNTHIIDASIASISVAPKVQYSLPSPASSSDESEPLNTSDVNTVEQMASGHANKTMRAFAQHLYG